MEVGVEWLTDDVHLLQSLRSESLVEFVDNQVDAFLQRLDIVAFLNILCGTIEVI